MSIEIRRIHADEYTQVRRICTVVFNGRRDSTQEDKPDPLENPHDWWWGAFENGKLQSCLSEIPFLMRFDGQSLKMSGIGGVGTLPEARKGGYVRMIFEKLLPEAYEQGAVFSNLTPFSHAFYRRFGYELACARHELRIPAGEFADLKMRGRFTQIFPGDDTGDLALIHSAYIAGLNHGICRDYWPDNRAWRVFTKNDPYATGCFLYLWRDDAGSPRAYIKYQHEKEEGENIKNVVELAFTDRKALYGVLSIVSGLSTQFAAFKWLMPAFIDPTDFIASMWDVKQSIIPRDMTRVINVKAALEAMRRPEGEGAYTLEVDDPRIQANTGRYAVEYGPEGTRVSFTGKAADLRCDIPALSQLVTGYRTLESALLTKQSGLEVLGSRETLDKVFTLRPQHLTEYF
jgi:predicted acetyltransferase